MNRNKVIMWCMLALSFFSACTTQQEEEFEAAVNTDEVKIMPKITDVLLDPISTRAGGRVALRFVMEAWQLDADNTTKMVVRRELKTENTYGATFTFEVEPGEYRLLFWADYIDAGAVADVNGYYADKYYNTKESATLYQGLKAVTINSAAYEINTEFRDAFYASCDFVKESGKGLLMDKQILERAMAKLILTERSEQAFKASKSLSVTYTVPSVFSVEKGKQTGADVYNVSYTDLPLVGDYDEKRGYTLCYDYLFAAKAGYTLGSISLKGKNANNVEYTNNTVATKAITIKQNTPTVVKGTNMLMSSENENPAFTNFTVSLSNNKKTLSKLFGGFNGRSSEGPRWTVKSFTDMVNWMSPSIVRYPGGTLANSWDWSKGGVMGKEIKNSYLIGDLVSGLKKGENTKDTKIVYVMNMVHPTPATGFSQETDDTKLRSDEVLQAKIADALAALKEFKDKGNLPVAVELGNELYFNKAEHYGIYTANPEQYLKHVPVIAAKIKEVYPEMKVILCTSKGGEKQSSSRDVWNSAILNALKTSVEFSKNVDGIVQHHYIKKEVGSQAVISDAVTAENMIAEGFKYVKSVQADYERVPEGKKLWITEYGLEEAGNALCGRWVTGLEYLAMSMSWINWADKVETIQLQHITLKPGVLTAELTKLSSVGIVYGELLRAIKGATIATQISVSVSDVANADAAAKLYGWQFTNETGKKVVLLLNSASTSKTEIDFSGIFSSGDNVKVTQYWSDIPYENNVSMGRGIEKEETTDVSRHTARPFSLSVFTLE